MATSEDTGAPGERPDTASDPSSPAGAVTARALLMIIGVLTLQLAFVLSYVGAFHNPVPRDIPIAVAAPEQQRQQLVGQLEDLPGSPLDPVRGVDDADAARDLIERREVDGALVLGADGTDTLLVTTAAGGSLAPALERVLGTVARETGRELRTEDVVPADAGDNNGLTPFYLVVGWCVGGYLCAAVMAVSAGAHPSNPARAVVRLAVLAICAVASGIGGMLIVDPVLGALPGSPIALAALGALLVFATGAATMALQGLVGVVGVGLAIALVVVLGNPSSGGAYAPPLLPPFWRDIGPFLPPGAGTSAVRSLVYFDGNAIGGPLLVLILWAVVGVVIALGAAVLRTTLRAGVPSSRRVRRPS
ncbi:DUF3533 domain-containing protein [Streptomyces alkaliphilus]|uniref:DUF3533 domain-containing protein n=1 Tax=Streptomyces alkaliphilus TaxID=1472722 RepID=UPI001E46C8EC|nr:DUF3533 domain-containing protein [Streptomyces alkaliphilus]